MTQLVLQISIGELTHDGNVILNQEGGFLPTLLENTHRLCQRAAMETDPIDAQQSITRLDRSFSGGRESERGRERESVRRLWRDRKPQMMVLRSEVTHRSAGPPGRMFVMTMGRDLFLSS